MEVTNNKEKSRYEVLVNGELAGDLGYVIDGDVIDFQHTIVPEKFGGKGIGSAMVRHAIAEIESEGKYKIKATCPFVVAFFKRHPEHADLLVESVTD